MTRQTCSSRYPSWFSASVKDLLNKILVPTPEKRFTMAQIKETEWFLEGGYNEDDEDGQALARTRTPSPSEPPVGIERTPAKGHPWPAVHASAVPTASARIHSHAPTASARDAGA